MPHHTLDQRLLADKLAEQKAQRKQPVDYGCFPLKKGFAMESQRQAAKHQTTHQRQPLAFFQPPLQQEQGSVDDYRTGNQYRCSAKNSAQYPLLPQQLKLAWFQFEYDKK